MRERRSRGSAPVLPGAGQARRQQDGGPFWQAVYRLVRQVPRGRVATYGDVARAAGVPGAARAVGAAMAHNRDTDAVPCHRVVRADGSLGGYQGAARDPGGKRARLAAEGVQVDAQGRIVDFARLRFDDFQPPPPPSAPATRAGKRRRARAAATNRGG